MDNAGYGLGVGGVRARPQADRATQASPRAAEASRPSGEYPSRMNTIGWLATSYVFGMMTVILIVRFG